MTSSVIPSKSEESYNKLIDIMKSKFSAERLEALMPMYAHFKERILVAPASSNISFHSAYAGGYLDHIHNVIKASYKVSSSYKSIGGTIDFSEEEMLFAAIHHDFGKLGDLDHELYFPNDSEWHIKNQGLIYKINKELSYMSITDRALFTLQHFGVKMTEKEYTAIKCSDGLFDEANKKYFITFQNQKINTSLHIIIHTADYLASRAEAEHNTDAPAEKTNDNQ